MTKTPVKGYGVAWHAGQDKGRVGLKLVNGQNVSLPIGSAAELAAVGVVLSQAPVFYDNGILRSGWEEVDD